MSHPGKYEAARAPNWRGLPASRRDKANLGDTRNATDRMRVHTEWALSGGRVLTDLMGGRGELEARSPQEADTGDLRGVLKGEFDQV